MQEKNFTPLEKFVTLNSTTIWQLAGFGVRLLGRTNIGRELLKTTGKTAGKLIVNTRTCGITKGNDINSIVSNWLKILDWVNCEYKIHTIETEEAEIHVLNCPAKLTIKNGKKVCDAGMSADITIVEKLGGRLIIEDSIARGADKCILKVVKKVL